MRLAILENGVCLNIASYCDTRKCAGWGCDTLLIFCAKGAKDEQELRPIHCYCENPPLACMTCKQTCAVYCPTCHSGCMGPDCLNERASLRCATMGCRMKLCEECVHQKGCWHCEIHQK